MRVTHSGGATVVHRARAPLQPTAWAGRCHHRVVHGPPLLHFLLGIAAAAALGFDRLALVAARPAAAIGRGDSKVDVLLRVRAHHEGGNVDNLLADADVAMADQHARVVDHGARR